MCEEELDAWNWMAKVNEKLTFLRLKCLNKKDITDDDYALLKILYRVWYDGEYPLYVTKMEGTAENVSQQVLFETDCQSNTLGKEIDINQTEPIIEENVN